MNARELMIGGLLVLVFLLVAGAAIGLGNWWSRRFSARSKALADRLGGIASQRQREGDPLLKASGEPGGALRRLLANLPGSQALGELALRSGTGLHSTDAAGLSAALGLALAGLAWLVSLPLLVSVLGLGGGIALPILYLQQKAYKRRVRFEDQLPEALEYMVRALRAGHGLTMAMGMVGDELPAPLGTEFKTTFDQVNVGLPFDTALSDLAERVNSNDLNFLVIALMIQRKTGGNLTELLGSLAHTIRERIKLNGKVRVLASEGKLSGVLIGSLPFVLGALLSVINPKYMSTLWSTDSGMRLVGICLIMIVMGGAWMWKITQIRV